MLKEVLASNAAKLVAACVCPVVGAGTIVMEVPKVRAAVHRATAPRAKPKPHREARAKPRVRVPEKAQEDDAPAQTALMCPHPLRFQDASFQPAPAPITIAPVETPRVERIYVPTGCGPVIGGGSLVQTGPTAGVPEPATWAQMIAGFALLGGVRRIGRRRRQRLA